ncbi:MAG: bifunctional demethylmenaquinone methyltransferase/2-methoxy-6-polyprenyl-1,4-benzoquinol methylase UbiE [Bacteroidota bacterium]
MTHSKSKKENVRQMFDNIAPAYDFMNHFLSFSIDKVWRRKLRNQLKKQEPETILDIATGTGDLAIELSKTKPKSIVGIDISEKMLEYGKKKVIKKKLSHIITLEQADCEDLSFEDNSFDAASIAFGIRNFEDPAKGLSEVFRVLKPGGMIYILEFGMPDKQPVKSIYKLYFNKILPFFGRMLSSDKKAYTYLPDSVGKFIHGDNFIQFLSNAGFKNNQFRKLSYGIAYLYYATKPNSQR